MDFFFLIHHHVFIHDNIDNKIVIYKPFILLSFLKVPNLAYLHVVSIY